MAQQGTQIAVPRQMGSTDPQQLATLDQRTRTEKFYRDEKETHYDFNLRYPMRLRGSKKLTFLQNSMFLQQSGDFGGYAEYSPELLKTDLLTVERFQPYFAGPTTTYIPSQARQDYHGHLANWCRLENCENETEMINMLKDWPEFRHALCFEPSFTDQKIKAEGEKPRSHCAKLKQFADQTIKRVLTKNWKVHLILNQTAREMPIQLNAPCLAHWLAWRPANLKTGFVCAPISVYEALRSECIPKLSERYIEEMMQNKQSPLFTRIDFDNPHPSQDHDDLLSENDYLAGCQPIWDQETQRQLLTMFRALNDVPSLRPQQSNETAQQQEQQQNMNPAMRTSYEPAQQNQVNHSRGQLFAAKSKFSWKFKKLAATLSVFDTLVSVLNLKKRLVLIYFTRTDRF